ncbi:MAG: hypothetical protein AAF532_04585 [Planctomycetota bacterium]
MRCPSVVALLLTAAHCVLPADRAVASGPEETTERRFHVPFRFDRAELDRLGAVEIRLFVSADRGRSWSLAATAEPGERRFPYEAPGDGEYWFAVRTIDRRGEAHPAGPIKEAGLKVRIDNAAPRVDLGLESLGDGAVGLTWAIDDPTLDLGSFTLEFREGGSGPWMPVAVIGNEEGRTSWRTAASRVEVRGSVRDRLGHRGFGQAEIDLATARPVTAPVGRPQPMRPATSAPTADPFFSPSPSFEAAPVFDPSPAPGGFASPGFSGQGGFTPTPTPAAGPSVPQVDFDSRLFGGSEGLDVPALPRLGPSPSLGPSASFSGSGPAIGGPSASGPTRSGPVASSPRLNNGFGFSAVPVSRPSGPIDPAPADGVFFEPVVENFASGPAVQTAPSPAANGSERIVRELGFEISYEIADVGPSGVSAVDFYITDDDGRSWYTYGPDKDRVSPFVATVPREGRYGFTMRIRNGQGFGADPPAAGDTPDVVVVVDRTAPRIDLAEPTVGRGAEAGTVGFRWRTDEQYPAATAVMLSYATSPDAAEQYWQPITTWEADRGGFVWRITPGLPSRVFARVSVRDAAGNVGHAVTRAPITIDMQRPQARITDIDGRTTR